MISNDGWSGWIKDRSVWRVHHDQPLYLVASFNDSMAFYRLRQTGTPSAGDFIVITRELIHAVALHSAKM